MKLIYVFIDFTWSMYYNFSKISSVFNGVGPYHIETTPLIRSLNQWTVFYIGTSFMKELRSCHKSMTEHLAKIVIHSKHFVIDVYSVFKYASESYI